MKNKMSLTQEEIEKIRKMKIVEQDWDTSQFPYMVNDQIIEVHQYIYNCLVKDVKKLRGGVSLGDIGVPIIIQKLLIETKKRFKNKNHEISTD